MLAQLTIRRQAVTAVSGNSVVTRAIENSDTHQAKFSIFRALAGSVEGRQISFVVRIRGRDNIGRFCSAAIFRALVASAVRIGVNTVLSWVISALVGAECAIDRVKEVVERGTFTRFQQSPSAKSKHLPSTISPA
jgi:hypothetical protein